MRTRARVWRSTTVVRRTIEDEKVTRVCEHLHTTPEGASECGSIRVRDSLRMGPVFEVGFVVEYSTSRHMWFRP